MQWLVRHKYWITISSFILLVVIAFSLFSKDLVQKELVAGDQTMMMTDSMRHTFKVSMMTSRAIDDYFLGVHTQDPELLQNALDYLDAAIGFIEMGYIDSQALRTTAEPMIQEMAKHIETYGLTLTPAQAIEIKSQLNKIYHEVEALEQNIWIDFQKNYIAFQLNEIHLRLVYKYAFFGGLLLLTLIAFLYHRQRKTVKRMIEQDQQLQQLAYFDTVTQTLNRRGLEIELQKRITQADLNQTPFYIGMVDLDNFKHINDVFGLPTGDALLIELSHRLQTELAEQDVLGRLGGDEFLILFDAAHPATRMIEKCQQIIQTMHPAFYISEN
jgi:diguanylate cyclase (GGDEF)-like protein